ncbi:type III CRISPR-associated RAMP protein Csx7 [Sphaerothrix gracilis]|uniref:type III CRISPR-associated RAMP protein Csx7 n=1 Tax=Sphaerothrix gracilis TaxID=3151835 RepID=UPI0031FE2C8B
MFDVFKNRLDITGTLTTVTALRISQGRSLEPIGSDLPVVKDALGKPLIPGSSFKGAMRSRLEAFLRGIHPDLAQDPSDLVSREMNERVKALKEQHSGNDEALTTALNNITDEVSKIFGTPWQASKFQVRDLTVKPETWFGQYQERDGVSINRDTETAEDGRLYDFQVVPAGVKFDFQAVIENAEDWELGLIMIGLHQFESEQIPLGGGQSRGLGVVKLDLQDVWWIDYSEDRPDELLMYLKRLIANEKDAHYKLSSESFTAYKQDWTEALIQHLNPDMAMQEA